MKDILPEYEEAQAYITFKGKLYKIKLTEFQYSADVNSIDSVSVSGYVVYQKCVKDTE